jgi:hypothetical protein
MANLSSTGAENLEFAFLSIFKDSEAHSNQVVMDLESNMRHPNHKTKYFNPILSKTIWFEQSPMLNVVACPL